MSESSPSDVTVVIPCYNSAAWLGRTIESVIVGAGSGVQIVVVDDGSTDDSLKVASTYRDRITLVAGRNRGACAARNIGLRMTTSKCVMFLDADDYLEGEFLTSAVRELARTGADVAFGPMCIETPSGKRTAVDNFKTVPSADELFEGWFDVYAQPPCSIVWKTDFIRRIGGWDERVLRNQDGEVVLRAMLSSPLICHFAAGLGVYNAHDEPSLSKARSIEPIRSEFYALERLFAAAKGTPFEAGTKGFAKRIYFLAHAAFSCDDVALGRSALKISRSLGFVGHVGTGRHVALSTLLGLETKSRLVAAFRRRVIRLQVPHPSAFFNWQR